MKTKWAWDRDECRNAPLKLAKPEIGDREIDKQGNVVTTDNRQHAVNMPATQGMPLNCSKSNEAFFMRCLPPLRNLYSKRIKHPCLCETLHLKPPRVVKLVSPAHEKGVMCPFLFNSTVRDFYPLLPTLAYTSIIITSPSHRGQYVGNLFSI